jgi:hypothetical protein
MCQTREAGKFTDLLNVHILCSYRLLKEREHGPVSTASSEVAFPHSLNSRPPITVPARYKAWAVFARSNTRIVGSNSTEGMDICVCIYSVFVLSCV